jgi:hypothetical protein
MRKEYDCSCFLLENFYDDDDDDFYLKVMMNMNK